MKINNNNNLNYNKMKNFLFILFLLVASLTLDAQVKFMGTKVDGSANVMISILKDKGFYDTGFTYENEGHERQILKGNFNGRDSNIFVLTNKGKVYRVYVCDSKNVNEAQIITDFNNLFYQFANNPKYILLSGNEIDRKEDISYEINCHNKVYSAYFYQILSDSMEEENHVWFKISEEYGKYFLSIYYDNDINKANGEDL